MGNSINHGSPTESTPASVSLFKLFKRGLFETIYASQVNVCSPIESSVADGNREHQGILPCSPEVKALDAECINPECPVKRGKSKTHDRGKTGAGVTGSRAPCKQEENEQLPRGAANPGLLRHLHNAARNRMPQCFEGACVSVKQTISDNWIMAQSLVFSSVSPGGYKLLLSYLDKNKKSTGLPYFLMETSPGGQTSCEMRVCPTQGSRATVVAQVADAELYSFESTFDAYFRNATASVIAVNKEFIAVHYLQRITENLSLGAELVARGHNTEVSSASAAARWFCPCCYTVSATLGNRGLDLCYSKVLTPFLTVAGMIEIGFVGGRGRSVGTLAYEWADKGWTFRASADSDGLVGAALHRDLGGRTTNLTCALSALLNHPNDKFRMGFGITASLK